MKTLLLPAEHQQLVDELRSRLGHVVLTFRQPDGNYLSVSMTREERADIDVVAHQTGNSIEELLG